ncbi:hypothetical protein [Anaerocolumna sp.]|uniref:hypothetical protein n=1 Tax=Anaerocolumna sp. TaxID=2041569 RepID=UPI0028AAF521|nr:hypothetical protein [Anaerocolumna sp.]
MDKNNKIMKAGLILIGVTLLLGVCTILFLRIKEPVFLKHYYEYKVYLQNEGDLFYSAGLGSSIKLQYITNISDDKSVISIAFKEAPSLYVHASEYQPDNFFTGIFHSSSNDNTLGVNIGTYSLRTVYLSLDIPIDVMPDQLELSEATILFNGGKQAEVNLGKLIFYKDELSSRDYLKQNRASSSSSGESDKSFELLDNIKIKSIDSPFLDKLKNYLNLKINNKEYTAANGKDYKKGDTLYISNSLNPNIRENFPFIKFEIYPRLYYQNSQGNTYYEPLFHISNDNYNNPSFLDFIKYVKFNQ